MSHCESLNVTREGKKNLWIYLFLSLMLGLRGMCPLWPPFQSSAEGNPGLPPVPPGWGFFRAKAPEADAAVPITSDLKPEVPGTANTFTFVNGRLLLPHERSLIPWTYAFNFSLKLQSNKLPAHIFLCQMFPLWWIWSTLGPAFEPHPLPVLPQTLLFSVKLISSFPPKKWLHLIHSSTWRETSLPHWPCAGMLMERMTHCWFLFSSL